MSAAQSLPIIGPLIRALGFLQMIEEALRIYIETAEKLIEAAVPYGVPFRADVKGLQNDTMGKLIDKFGRLNRNTGLITELKQLTKHRNYIAHAAFRRVIQGASNGTENLAYMEKHAHEVGDASERLLAVLAQEMRSLILNYPNIQSSTAWNQAEQMDK